MRKFARLSIAMNQHESLSLPNVMQFPTRIYRQLVGTCSTLLCMPGQLVPSFSKRLYNSRTGTSTAGDALLSAAFAALT